MFPILISIGPLHITSFVVFSVIAWMIFSFLFWRQLRNQAVNEDQIYQLMYYGTLAAIVGSRLGYVVTHQELFAGSLWIRAFTPWIQSGFSLYGAFIFGGGLMLAMSRSYLIPRSLFLDAFTIGFSSAFTWISLAAFLEGSVLGKPTTLPIGIKFADGIVRHPTALYEMFTVFIIIAFLNLMKALRKQSLSRSGMYALWFFFLFSIAMFCLEFIKESPVYFSRLSINQWVCIGIFAESSGALITWGGGLKFVRQYVPKLYKRVRSAIGGMYAKFSKRDTQRNQETT